MEYKKQANKEKNLINEQTKPNKAYIQVQRTELWFSEGKGKGRKVKWVRGISCMVIG